VARAFDLSHGFWVVLGTLSVLRSNALGTGRSIVSALAGTAVGIVVGAANDVHRLAELELGEHATMQAEACLCRVEVGQPGDHVGLARHG
jgi:hypothetical protein